jgi:hypothetical protein
MSLEGEGPDDEQTLRAGLARAEVARAEDASFGAGFDVRRCELPSFPDWLDGRLSATIVGDG